MEYVEQGEVVQVELSGVEAVVVAMWEAEVVVGFVYSQDGRTVGSGLDSGSCTYPPSNLLLRDHRDRAQYQQSWD